MKVSSLALLAITLLSTVAFNPTKASAAELNINLTNQQSRISVGIGDNKPQYQAYVTREEQQRIEQQRRLEEQHRLEEQRLAEQRARELREKQAHYDQHR